MTVTIPPGGFARKEYLLDAPLSEGRITLNVSNYNQILLVAQNNAPPAVSPSSSETPSGQLPPVPHPMDQFIAKHLSTYEPIYFILGSLSCR